jgi:putative membrane protein
MAWIRHTGLAACFLGIAALIGLTLWSGAGLVGQAMASVGAGTLLIALVRLVTVSTAGAGWWLVFPRKERPLLRTCVAVRIVREGANALLPFAQFSGELIGARVLTFYGVPGPLAAASVIVDVLLQAGTQFLFALLGLCILVVLGRDQSLARDVAIGLALALPALGGFYLVQRRFGHRILRYALDRLAGDHKWLVLGTVDAVYRYLESIYARRSGLVTSTVVHLAGWLIGAAEVMIALAFMGHPVDVAEALVIESLLHAIRGAAFAIPGALGAQEGGLILLCSIFGIPPDEALALSLVKRVADLAIGIPGLIGWQVLEGAQLRRNHAMGGSDSREVPH